MNEDTRAETTILVVEQRQPKIDRTRLTRDERLQLLRVRFPDNEVTPKPKPTKNQKLTDDNRLRDGIRCDVCGGWHHKDVIHLAYVGHAAATNRLLDADLEWNWRPLATDQNGLPLFDKDGGLWIGLTICEVTRLGYGNADQKETGASSAGDRTKEVIGDAIRNAAMRFGVALELWHKGGSLGPADGRLPRDEDDGGNGTGEDGGQQQSAARATPQRRSAAPAAKTASNKPAAGSGIVPNQVKFLEQKLGALKLSPEATAEFFSAMQIEKFDTSITLARFAELQKELDRMRDA